MSEAPRIAPDRPPMPVQPTSGYAELPHFGLIRFAGTDAQPFLQGQLSCDVNTLQPGQAVYGSYNTPKGRMLASFLLWRDDTGYVMQLPRPLCEPLCRRLSMYILRSRVSARDISNETTLFGVAGVHAGTSLAPLCRTIPATPLTVVSAGELGVLRVDADRLQIIAPAHRAGELHLALGKALAQIPPAIWDLMNVRAGIPLVTVATQDQFVPQMANMDLIGGVSFSKGCYPGQEIVARMHYLGRLKQRMFLANIAGEDMPLPGDKLYSPDTGDQATGMIVNAAPASEGGYDVLAVMHIASFRGGDVHLNSPAGPPLKFIALPYALPS